MREMARWFLLGKHEVNYSSKKQGCEDELRVFLGVHNTICLKIELNKRPSAGDESPTNSSLCQ